MRPSTKDPACHMLPFPGEVWPGLATTTVHCSLMGDTSICGPLFSKIAYIQGDEAYSCRISREALNSGTMQAKAGVVGVGGEKEREFGVIISRIGGRKLPTTKRMVPAWGP